MVQSRADSPESAAELSEGAIKDKRRDQLAFFMQGNGDVCVLVADVESMSLPVKVGALVELAVRVDAAHYPVEILGHFVAHPDALDASAVGPALELCVRVEERVLAFRPVFDQQLKGIASRALPQLQALRAGTLGCRQQRVPDLRGAGVRHAHVDPVVKRAEEGHASSDVTVLFEDLRVVDLMQGAADLCLQARELVVQFVGEVLDFPLGLFLEDHTLLVDNADLGLQGLVSASRSGLGFDVDALWFRCIFDNYQLLDLHLFQEVIEHVAEVGGPPVAFDACELVEHLLEVRTLLRDGGDELLEVLLRLDIQAGGVAFSGENLVRKRLEGGHILLPLEHLGKALHARVLLLGAAFDFGRLTVLVF